MSKFSDVSSYHDMGGLFITGEGYWLSRWQGRGSWFIQAHGQDRESKGEPHLQTGGRPASHLPLVFLLTFAESGFLNSDRRDLQMSTTSVRIRS